MTRRLSRSRTRSWCAGATAGATGARPPSPPKPRAAASRRWRGAARENALDLFPGFLLHLQHNGSTMIEVAEVIFDAEPFALVWAEALPLLEANHEETGRYADVPPSIIEECYTRMEAAGALRVYTAREDDE